MTSLAAFGTLAERLVRPGVSVEDARLAVAMLGQDAPLQRAVDFAAAVSTLRAMGFPADRICGALLLQGTLEGAATLLSES